MGGRAGLPEEKRVRVGIWCRAGGVKDCRNAKCVVAPGTSTGLRGVEIPSEEERRRAEGSHTLRSTGARGKVGVLG